jgi:DNA polymerase-3 subunit alpha
MPTFNHLHCHTQFSLLDGAASISDMIKKAKEDNMRGVAMTDHGNMFGAFQFVAEANKAGIKPIVGCEFYLVNDRHKKQFTKEDKDVRRHQLFLAKNEEGYKNLVKMCSLGFIEGMYGKYPRIDKELVLKYHKGLIATTCCLGAEVPQTILKHGEIEGEKAFKWWLDIFGEDYYVEIQRHSIPEQQIVNDVLLKFAKKYNVKVIASNDSHYVNQEDANAHDILLCINTGEKQSTPTMKDFNDDDGSGGKGRRFAFYNDQFYFKNTQEMSNLFHDLPQAIDNTNEIVDKVTELKLKKDILLPNFPVPEEFKIHTSSEFHKTTELVPDVLNQWEFLKHLTFEGARKRYQEITPEIEERINFELFTIKTMGFAGYFLIVMDFIQAGRDIGVFIGPGRGSAAGSVVAYCIQITNIDPIKYNLLFERFLNPDRKSMPDIDTDFDDEGRQKVIDYVVQKYGKNQVAQIITYGTMAAKMSIKDVSRVMELPLQEANILAKLVPDKPGISLNRVLTAPIDGAKSLKENEGLQAEDLDNVRQLREILGGTDLRAKVLKEALILEGSVRGTGIHAAGIIIAPSDLTDLIPVAVAKDSDLLVTQFEGKIIEDAGVIKMDFLGLKTLTIIRDALGMIKKNHGIEIIIDDVDLEDEKTYELYQRGETNATFQFESAGMQKHLKDLKPDKFADLIAMNALYRPGPIEYIPNYINRKHGREEIIFDLPEMEEFLGESYGITVYQEQVMLLSQKIGGFTKGDADVLRKAMGKKDRYTLDKMKPKFIEGAMEKGHPADKLEKIWLDWEAFAQYAFNKSHSTCYAFVAYQTAWLKAHYPGEYMASVLTHNQSNMDKVTFFLDECKRANITVLGPDVNESGRFFDVNKAGEIRFGLGAIKGTGDAAVDAVIKEREENGPYADIYDFAKRVNLRTVNKKTFESFAQGGAFDCFEDIHRAQYMVVNEVESTPFIERLIRYGNSYQENKNAAQNSLFGNMSSAMDIAQPKPTPCEPWDNLVRLKIEKDLIGLYLSGHPLDQYRMELENFCTDTLDNILVDPRYQNKDVCVGGIITNMNLGKTQRGDTFARFTLEDYNGNIEMAIFSKDYISFAQFISPGNFLYINGKIQKKWKSETDYELKPTMFKLLSEIKAEKTKGIQINIDVRVINEALIQHLETLTADNAGKYDFRVNVKSENMTVELFSRKIRIDTTIDLLKELDLIEGLTYKILAS